MGKSGQRFHVVRAVIGFFMDGALRRFGQDEMGFDLGMFAEDFQQPDAIDDTGCAGEADDQSFHHGWPPLGLGRDRLTMAWASSTMASRCSWLLQLSA